MDFRFYRSPAPSGQEGAVYNTDASFVSLYYFNNTVILFDLNVKGGGEYSEFLKNGDGRNSSGGLPQSRFPDFSIS